MGNPKAILERARGSPSGVRFSELQKLVEALGYSLARTRGSHHIYTAAGLPMINLQKDKSGKAKPYQVSQVLDIIESNNLSVE